jgi:DNA-binding HxlR family transcriptional regulator
MPFGREAGSVVPAECASPSAKRAFLAGCNRASVDPARCEGGVSPVHDPAARGGFLLVDEIIEFSRDIRKKLCPVSRAICMLEKKWTIHIIYELAAGKQRFCQLQEAMGNPNARTLSERLKELEEQGILRRDVINTIPPWVEYSLTEKGLELRRIVEDVARWARKWSMFSEEECWDASEAESEDELAPCLPCREVRRD